MRQLVQSPVPKPTKQINKAHVQSLPWNSKGVPVNQSETNTLLKYGREQNFPFHKGRHSNFPGISTILASPPHLGFSLTDPEGTGHYYTLLGPLGFPLHLGGKSLRDSTTLAFCMPANQHDMGDRGASRLRGISVFLECSDF